MYVMYVRAIILNNVAKFNLKIFIIRERVKILQVPKIQWSIIYKNVYMYNVIYEYVQVDYNIRIENMWPFYDRKYTMYNNK